MKLSWKRNSIPDTRRHPAAVLEAMGDSLLESLLKTEKHPLDSIITQLRRVAVQATAPDKTILSPPTDWGKEADTSVLPFSVVNALLPTEISPALLARDAEKKKLAALAIGNADMSAVDNRYAEHRYPAFGGDYAIVREARVVIAPDGDELWIAHRPMLLLSEGSYDRMRHKPAMLTRPLLELAVAAIDPFVEASFRDEYMTSLPPVQLH